MSTTTQQSRSPLGSFPDKPAPRLYNSMVEVLRVRHYSHNEEAYVAWIRKDVRTTMNYTHLLNRGGRGVRSPAYGLARCGDGR